jgi:hypothetical protein
MKQRLLTKLWTICLLAMVQLGMVQLGMGATIDDNFNDGELNNWRPFARNASGVVDSTLGNIFVEDGRLAIGLDLIDNTYRGAVTKTISPVSGNIFYSFTLNIDKGTTRNFATIYNSNGEIVTRLSIGKCRVSEGNEVNSNFAITTSMQADGMIPETEILIGTNLFVKQTDFLFTFELNTNTDLVTVSINGEEYPEATNIPFINPPDDIATFEFWQYYTYGNAGYFWLDNIILSTEDKAALLSVIANTEDFLNNAVTGTEPGNFPQADLTVLEDSLNVAKTIAENSSSQERYDEMTINLNQQLKNTRWTEIIATSVFKGNLVEILGDTKQLFGNKKASTTDQLDYLLLGFRKMHCTGVRVPIFTKDSIPDPELLDYFIKEAIAHGFKIFANPMEWAGGQRLANGTRTVIGDAVKDDDAKTQALIDRIIEFSAEYPCDWINAFNEDGQPDGSWSAAQFNTIYSSLYGNVNGADLIGACPWGIPAAINVLKNTDIENYITVSTTHNLGFDHDSWDEFIELSRAASLPVWDSEVNINDKYGTGTRIEVAVAKGVDGLVLYSSSDAIDMSTGEITNTDWLDNILASSSATITSSVYTIDSIALTISNVPYATTLTDFETNLIPTNGSSFITYQADSAIIATDVQYGYKVIVTAEDKTTTAIYTIILDASNDASITSTVYSVDEAAKTITDIPYATSLTDFEANLTPATGASFATYQEDGITEATTIQTGFQVIVTAQVSSTTAKYTVTVDKNSDASITSTLYSVDEEAKTISDVTYATTLADFEANLTAAEGATFITYEPDGTTIASEILSDYIVKVTAENGTSTSSYTVSVEIDDAINDNKPLEGSIYPNPTNGILHINVTTTETYNYEICNLCGVVINSGVANGETTININNLKAGMYFIKLNSYNKVLMQTIQKL